MSKNYLVKLTPTGKFFFGGDMRFGVNGKDEKNSSYIIESSKMPQQTSLLGMMRFLLLSNNNDLFDIKNNCIRNGVSVDDLIGKSSFSVSDGSENTFGKIITLGPCCVYRDGKRYFKAPMDNGFSSINWDNVTSAVINGKNVELPELKVINDKKKEELYKGKHIFESFFMDYSSKEVIKENEIFKKDTRIGIDKENEGKRQTNAFYKQISYRLEESYCFAFDIEVDDDIDLTEYNGQLVNLGADASTFVFEAEIIQTLEKDIPEGLTVVLLSDTYITKDDIDKCEIRYSITQTRPFRFISTTNNSNTSYYRINAKNAAERSERYELYEAGSVFYFKDEENREKFCDFLENRKDFIQIGYNKYYIK